jgi:N-acetylmuramoyl-L-alanine amidase
MIDPAHGGIESGAVLNPTILEKDVTLAVAEHLRQDLTSRGIVTALVREGDANLSTDDRAAAANLERPSLYLSLHASSEVGALRIFSASLPDTVNGGGPFAQWESAQTQSLAGSRAAEQQIAAALQTSGFAVRQLTAPLRPLNNVMVPAIAIEFGPPSANVVQLDSPEFQRSLSIALANSIAAWLSHPQTAAPNPSVGGAATTGAPH